MAQQQAPAYLPDRDGQAGYGGPDADGGSPLAAQQIWSSVHGAVALELKGLVLTPDPEATYRATLQTLLRGLAPQA